MLNLSYTVCVFVVVLWMFTTSGAVWSDVFDGQKGLVEYCWKGNTYLLARYSDERRLAGRGENTSALNDPAIAKVMRLFVMSQGRHREHRLPVEVQRIIGCFADYNDIETLFDILTSPQERKRIIGFESYDQMDRQYPSKRAKVAHLRSLRSRTPYSSIRRFTVKGDGVSIAMIDWSAHCNQRRAPRDIVWSAMRRFRNLKLLYLNDIGISISMTQLAQLPPSLKVLDIGGNVWVEPNGDLDLNLLPLGLSDFSATFCQGMNGTLKLFAPRSTLETVNVRGTNFWRVTGWTEATIVRVLI